MYINRTNQKVIEDSFESSFITAVLGSRRTGKSTFVQHYAEKTAAHHKWAFLNMDKMQEKRRIEKGELKAVIEEAAGQFIGNQQKLWVCIDEVQKCPEIFDQIKLLYDTYKNQNAIKFILTGSGFLSLHRFSAESLAGRIQLHYLREFNLQESTLLKEKVTFERSSLLDALCQGDSPSLPEKYVTMLRPFKSRLEKGLEDLLVFGGFPEVIEMELPQNKIAYLGDYLQTYLEKDILSISEIAHLPLYQNMMRVIAEQTGSLKDDLRLIQALGCSRNTLKKYRGYLIATLLYQEIYPYIGSSLKRLVKSPKSYLANNGLVSYLTGVHSLQVLKSTGSIGHRFENWFLNELLVFLDRQACQKNIFFWRTNTGAEVDFVVEVSPAVFPFEVTCSNQVQRNKLNNLSRFLKQEPKAKFGCYVYTGEYRFDSKLNIFFLPAWAVG
jgi:hypothetical protein